ncbi:MAG: signal peptidase II, partial [Spirochaetales bacterium]
MTDDKQISEAAHPDIRSRINPLSLMVGVILLDQITKALIVARVEIYTVGAEYFGGLVRIIHTRNPAVAFSLGQSIPEPWRSVVVTVIPALVLIGVFLYYWFGTDLTPAQRWMLAGVIGGGFGNLIDRFIRSQGVVDFADVEFFGIFGLDRWPTFNVADSSVVVCGILFVVSVIRLEHQRN